MAPELETLIDGIRRIMPPQRGEVGRLKYQVKEGNVHARERMVEMYLRLAIRIAVSRAKAYDLDLSETVGDAFIGMLNAVDKYDPDYSGPFSSYVSFWIFQSITREQSTRNPHIYFPVHRKEWFFTMYPHLKLRGCTECEDIYECKKVIDMITEKIECNRNQASDVLLSILPALSFEEIMFDEEKSSQFYYSDESILDQVDEKLRVNALHEALSDLTERQRNILENRYGLNDGIEKTLEQVGQLYCITRERVRQIENKALRRIAHKYRGKRRAIFIDGPCKKNEKKRK